MSIYLTKSYIILVFSPYLSGLFRYKLKNFLNSFSFILILGVSRIWPLSFISLYFLFSGSPVAFLGLVDGDVRLLLLAKLSSSKLVSWYMLSSIAKLESFLPGLAGAAPASSSSAPSLSVYRCS